MKKTTQTLILIFLSSFLAGQIENSQWYFGNHAGLDFTTVPPTILNNSTSNSNISTSSVADGAGNLLFYTDGMTVYDKSHNVMANGSNLGTVTNTNGLTYQYTLITKKPGSSNIYLVFSNSQNTFSTTAGLYYSIVDMSLAAGMGSVTIKNAPIYTNTPTPTGQLALVQHCNGNDVWLLAHDYNTPHYKAYLITAAGVSLTPILSNGSANVISGFMKVAPNGKKIVTNSNYFGVTLYDFDSSTGIMSNSLSIGAGTLQINAAEFSPDGTKLYATIPKYMDHHITQWNLCAGSNSAIIASGYTFAAVNVGTGMQLAPDGKIYVSHNLQNSLGVINNPNNLGAACNYSDTGQSLGTATCNYGLPSFISRPLPAAPFTYTANCQTVNFMNSVSFIQGCTANASLTTVYWNFGDPSSASTNTTSVTNPTHQFTSPGTYTTTMILQSLCRKDTVKKVITITSPSPTFAVSGPTAICKGITAGYSITSSGVYNYTWSTGANTKSISVSPQNSTSYTVTSTNTLTGCTWEKQISLTVNNCTGFDEVSSDMNLFTLFPNPASEKLHVGLSDKFNNGDESAIVIMDYFGRIVFSKPSVHEIEQIDISGFAKGVYVLRYQSKEMTQSKKFIIE